MAPALTVTQLREVLRHRRHFIAEGRSDAWIRAAVRNGALTRVARGFFAETGAWSGLGRAEQHLLRVLAVDSAAQRPPVFSHVSAATLLGLPLIGFDTRRVHMRSAAAYRPHSGGAIVRHRRGIDDPETVRTEKLIHTDLIATVIDVAMTESFECGVVCADAAIRRLVRETGESIERIRGSDGSYPGVRSRFLERLEAMPRSAGLGRARRVLRFASPLSESPLESLGHLQLRRLGFRVRQQSPVTGPNGSRYWLDAELLGYGMFVELDGRRKYVDEEMRNGRSADEVFMQEKHREDWVRGTTRKGVIRGAWKDSQSVHAMASLLRGYGIEPPHPPDAPPLAGLY